MARPIAADHAAKRAALLRAAEQLFATQGFAATGIAQLAQASAGSKARLYHYFPTKHAVLQTLLTEHLQRLNDALQEVHAQADRLGLDGQARLALLMHRLIILGTRHADAAAVLRHELRQLDATAMLAIAPALRMLDAHLDRAIRLAAPALPEDQLPLMRAALRGLIDPPAGAAGHWPGLAAAAAPAPSPQHTPRATPAAAPAASEDPAREASRYAEQAARLFVYGLRGMLAAASAAPPQHPPR
ncbi:MAG TPA: helix-turn-helix domain-containing protein [Burkholderiaceae bacterium]|nr:helix-turn-helix domain-containing protein [Burkholderiaceae bacterium]